MAVPTIVGVGTFANATTAALAVPLPAGVVAGDLLLLFVEAANEPLNATAGWTDVGVGTVAQATGLVTSLTVRWKVAGVGETAPSISSNPQNHLAARIVAVRGANTTTPINITATGVDNTTGTAFSIPGATTTAPDCLVFAALATGTDINSTTMTTGWANASLTALTEQVDNWTVSGNGGGITVATGGKATAGAYGATTGTITTGNTKALMSFAVPAAPATNWTAAPSDSGGVTDTIRVTLTRGITDPAGAGDTVADAQGFDQSVTDDTGQVDTTDASLTTSQQDYAYTVDDQAGVSDARQAWTVEAVGTDPAGVTDDVTVELSQAGTAWTVTVADPAGASDTATPLKSGVAAYTVNDSGGAADAAQLAGQWARAVDDLAGAGDAAGLTTARRVDDPAGSGDPWQMTAAWAQSVADNAGSADAVTTAKSGSAAYTVDDSAGAADGTQVLGVWVRQADDTAGVTDTAQTALARQVSDPAGPTDLTSLGVARAVTDDPGLRDATSTAAASVQAFTDAAGSTDSQPLAVGRQVDDTTGSSDAASSLRFALITVTDTAGSADTQAQAQGFGVVLTDDAGAADPLALTATWARSVSDTAGAADTAVAALLGVQWTATVTDTGGPVDALSAAHGWAQILTDTGGATDAPALIGVWLRTVTDPAGLIDALTTGHGLTVTDLAAVTDDVTLTSFTGKQVTGRRDLGRTVREADGTTGTISTRTLRALLGVTARTGTGRTSGL